MELAFFSALLVASAILVARTLEVSRCATDAKSQFLANMSHEIRTPMNAISGLNLLLQNTELNATQRDYCAKMQGASISLLALLNDILDFSKIEAGKMTIEPVAVSLESLFTDLSVIMAASSSGKPVDLMFDLDPALPKAILADHLRLRQILINLATNAIKFTPSGQIVVSAKSLSAQTGRACIEFCISDTGIGIDAAVQKDIFSAFTQAEASTTRRFGGTGLGLSISKRFLELMGATLKLQSQPGEGSRFSFELDCPLAELPSKGPHPRLPPPRGVLIVDDNSFALEIAARMAQSLGWPCDTAEGGPQALAIIQAKLLERPASFPYDFVIMDLQMPILDGWCAMAEIKDICREAGFDQPLACMLTAHGREALASFGNKAKGIFDAIAEKPATASMIEAAYARALESRAPKGAANTSDATSNPLPLAGFNLLLVEDNPTNQQIARELLATLGANVDVAGDGQAGVEAVLAAPYDAVLMDIQMPVLDGHGAARAIRSKGFKNLPIIAMTANASQQDRLACLASGMDEHVAKPFELDSLCDMILRLARPSGTSNHPLELLSPEQAIARMGGHFAIYLRSASAFRDALASSTRELSTLGNKADAIAFGKAIHSLKGMAASLGALELARLCAQAQTQLSDDNAASLSEIAARLTECSNQTRIALDDYLVGK